MKREEVAAQVGGRAVQADVASPEEGARLVEEAGDVDVLVNNAGLTRDGLIARMSDEDWRVVLDTNLGGVFHTCRAAARGMMKRKSGSIVNLTSVVGVHGNPGQTNYAASKAGIIGFTKALARELGAAQRPRECSRSGLHHDGAHRGAAGASAAGDSHQHAPRADGHTGGRRRGGPLSLLRRSVVRDGRGAARRRRTGDVR